MNGATVQSLYAGTYKAEVTADYATDAGTASSASTATSAGRLTTGRNISISDADGTNTGTAVSFNGASAVTLKLPSTIKATKVKATTGFEGALTGNASTATKLAATKTIKVALGSSAAANFDGSANVTPGVSGTLGAGNGGTGQTSLVGAMDALAAAYPVSQGAEELTGAINDDTVYLSGTNSGTLHYGPRKVTKLFDYIKNKLTATDIPALPASKITSGTFASARIADGAVTTAKLANSAVTNAKLGSDISASKITAGNTTLGAYTARRIYIGTSTPGASAGAQGDIFIVY